MSRRAISAVAWALCLPALLMHLFLVFISFGALTTGELALDQLPAAVPVYFGIVLGCGAWYGLYRMNVHWLRDEPMHWPWPLLATAMALAGLATFASGWIAPAVLASPGIVFAVFLVGWNLRTHFARARRESAT